MAEPIKLPEKLGTAIDPDQVFDAFTAYYPAGPDHYGFTNPHVALLNCARDYKGITAYAIFRKDFQIGSGPQDLRRLRQDTLYKDRFYEKTLDRQSDTLRGWKKIETLCEEMPFEDALRIAEEIAKRDNVLLYEGRTMGCALDFHDPKRLLWKPENWRAIVG